MHKIVNGIKIELTPDEAAKIRSEWKLHSDLRARESWLHSRITEYPSIEDQLDMLYHAIDEGKQLDKSTFYQEIKRIKTKYPKPS